jgi:hypothetical protein
MGWNVHVQNFWYVARVYKWLYEETLKCWCTLGLRKEILQCYTPSHTQRDKQLCKCWLDIITETSKNRSYDSHACNLERAWLVAIISHGLVERMGSYMHVILSNELSKCCYFTFENYTQKPIIAIINERKLILLPTKLNILLYRHELNSSIPYIYIYIQS